MQFEANTSNFFTIFDSLVVLTAYSDAKMSRSGNFYADDNNRRTKPITLPFAHARGVIILAHICNRGRAPDIV